MASLDDLDSLKKGEIVLVVTSAQKYLSVSMEILNQHLNKKKDSCVYVTVNKPYTALMNTLKENKINTDKLFVIDAITPTSAKHKDEENAVFIGSPNGLTDISISATAAINSIKDGERLLFLDSLSTLLVYNEVGSVTRFVHFLVNKMKEWNVYGVILALEKGSDEKMLSQLSQFVDRVIEVK